MQENHKRITLLLLLIYHDCRRQQKHPGTSTSAGTDFQHPAANAGSGRLLAYF
jgi:hypothetical protein